MRTIRLLIVGLVTYVNWVNGSEGVYDCYGDVTRLSTAGASEVTSRRHDLTYEGIKASQALVDMDRSELDAMADCYLTVGRKHCIHPALIAALASRESGGGRLLAGTNGWGGRNPQICSPPSCPLCQDGRCAYGILQCDVRNSQLKERCLRHAWDSCEHINMMIKEQLVGQLDELRHQHEGEAGWSSENLLLGGLDAYNNGLQNARHSKNMATESKEEGFTSDVVARAQYLISTRPWAAGGGTCGLDALAEARDCRFYQCLEQQDPCGEDGYALGFGEKLCKKTVQQRPKFTERGRRWLDDVTRCMMSRVLSFHANPGRRCETMKETALTDHVTCYIQHGFCSNILGQEPNWQPFIQIFQQAGFKEADKITALQQVVETARACVNHPYVHQVIIQQSVVDSFLEKINNILLQVPAQELGSTESCEDLAANGDCRFYECVDRRHQCRDDVRYSQIFHFELTHCTELEGNSDYNDQTREFTSKYQTCLMSWLFPITNQTSVRCPEFYIELSRRRQECLEEAGICNHGDLGMLLYQGFSLHGYPSLTPDFMNSMLSRNLDIPVPTFYYRHLTLVRSRVADTVCKCGADAEGRCEPFYTPVMENRGDVIHLVEATKRNSAPDDARCTQQRGKCQILPKRCHGNYKRLCGGPSNRLCCVPNP